MIHFVTYVESSFLLKFIFKMISGKTPEEIRKTFNIKNDFTPEEEEQVHLFPFVLGMPIFKLQWNKDKALSMHCAVLKCNRHLKQVLQNNYHVSVFDPVMKYS